MNVCLITRYFDMRNAGIGRVSTEIFKGLVKRGHSVHIISTNGTSLYSYFRYTLLELPFKIPKKGIDVYHALTPMEGIWVPKDRSVVTFYDLIPITDPDKAGAGMGGSGWKRFIGSHYFGFGCGIATGCKSVVCISEKTRQDVIARWGIPESDVKVIRLGIRNDLKPYLKRDGTFRLGYLGQLDRRKRVDLLIKAFKGSDIEGELVIGGIGVDEHKLKALAGDDERIKFLGLVPDNNLVDFYNSLDVLVFPTWIEGYGLPPVEAMACRKPVIVLNDAIIPQEVKSRCIIVEDLNVTLGTPDYLTGLIYYVDYDGNEEFAKEHNWDKCVDEYVELYKEIVR